MVFFLEIKELEREIAGYQKNLERAHENGNEIKRTNGPGLAKFEFNIDNEENFPEHGCGNVIFERKEFINQIADRVLTKFEGLFGSYYWRAPSGSGKSVFLKLIGRELQMRGCDVYSIPSAENLNNYPDTFFLQLAKMAGDKTVVLLIDNVPNNFASGHWVRLLKAPPANLLVLGVGRIPVDRNYAFFGTIFPEGNEMFPVFLNDSDFPEVKDRFANLYPDLPHSIRDEACEKILEYTAGHIFPFVAIVDHILQKNRKENVDLDGYLFSKEFLDSAFLAQVNNRCFQSFNGNNLNKVENYLFGKTEFCDSFALRNLGVVRQGLFTSLFITDYIFRTLTHCPHDVNEIALDDSGNTSSAEQIICAGLRYMNEEDFQGPEWGPTPPLANVIGFRWAAYVRGTHPNLFFTLHSLRMTDDCTKPTIGFMINGKLNLGLEILLNGSSKSVEEHLSRSDEKYKRYQDKENRIIFHIDTISNEFEKPYMYQSDDARNRIYTFLKNRNALYRGSIEVKKGVSQNLPAPPRQTRPYSPFTFSYVRRVVKFSLS